MKGRVDLKVFTAAVLEEYNPHGFRSASGMAAGPNTLDEYEMRKDTITVRYLDAECKKQTRIYSWQDFAVEILKEME